MTLRCVEFYDDVACDLLSPSPGERAASRGGGEAPPVVVDRDARAGPVVLGAAAPRVHSADDARRLLREARGRRDAYADAAAARACGACYVELEIHHLARPPGGGAPGAAPAARAPYLTADEARGGWARHCASRVVLVEWPGLEKLAVPRDALVLGEGSHRHRTLLAFQACLDDLARPCLSRRGAPFHASQLTELLAEAWGGNATLACLACVGAGDAAPVKKAALDACAALGACRQFPVARRATHVGGLDAARRTMRAVLEAAARDARREAAKLRRARRGENAPGDSDDDEAYGHALRERLGALERALASSQETAATAREDSVKVYKVLELFKAKYTALADHKAKLAKDLIVAEQAKLEVARALVDAKLRASDVDEAKARDAFGRESEVLAAKEGSHGEGLAAARWAAPRHSSREATPSRSSWAPRRRSPSGTSRPTSPWPTPRPSCRPAPGTTAGTASSAPPRAAWTGASGWPCSRGASSTSAARATGRRRRRPSARMRAALSKVAKNHRNSIDFLVVSGIPHPLGVIIGAELSRHGWTAAYPCIDLRP